MLLGLCRSSGLPLNLRGEPSGAGRWTPGSGALGSLDVSKKPLFRGAPASWGEPSLALPPFYQHAMNSRVPKRCSREQGEEKGAVDCVAVGQAGGE